MLLSLSVRDVVLIDRLTLDPASGLCVLTGETGAGKTILLDALGLALGARAEARLVRHGAERAVAVAEFDPPAGHPARAMIAEAGLDDSGETLVLRRTLSTDGRSRAFINDQSTSVSLLRRVGESLVELQGQFEAQGLLDPKTHRRILDAYGGLDDLCAAVAEAHRQWGDARRRLTDAEESHARALREEDFLRHAADELVALAPKEGEEAALAESRSLMMHGGKLMEALDSAAQEIKAGAGVEGALRGAMHRLERVAESAAGRVDGILAGLERAASEVAEVEALLDRVIADADFDPQRLDQVEERLFALRGLARKHQVAVDDLPDLAVKMGEQVRSLESGEARLNELRQAESAAKRAYESAADALSKARRDAALRLDHEVARELPPLKLDKARFATVVETREEEQGWGEHGRDQVSFRVATNPRALPGPLNKIASGGELARFMLALKARLAEADPIPTLIFDEVDAGVGGAVADAVGERLARLARAVQVLVVTHSPQVAARAQTHWRVAKVERDGQLLSEVVPLDESARREEVARMLAGAKVTDAARAAADSLLEAP